MTARKNTREKIGDAAIRLFVKNGVAETSMRDIAKVVGVTEAALYRHFQSKDTMVWELFKEQYDLFAEYLEKTATQKNTKTKVAALVKSCCELFDQSRDIFFFLLMTQHTQRFYPKNYQPKLPLLVCAIIQEGIDKKELPLQDSELSTAMVMGMVMQTASYLLHHDAKASLSTHCKQLAESCWQVLKLGKVK